MLWEKDGVEEDTVDSKDRDATREGESALLSVYLVAVRYGTTRGKYRGRYLVPPRAGSHTFHGDNI